VVLLHGFAEDGDVWRYQQPELSKQYKLLIPDLPGSGQSEMIDDMSMEGMAACIKDLLEAEADSASGPVTLTMIGHSMGGYITLAFAEKWPSLLAGFGLFHSTAYADTEEKKTNRQRSIGFIQTHGSYDFIRQSTPNLFTETYRIKNSTIVAEMIGRYSSFDPLALIAYYEAMIKRPDRIAVLQSFSRPVLFIIGKHDTAIPFKDSMKQCHIPQQAVIHVLETSAHMGMWEQKENSTECLLNFLRHITVQQIPDSE